MSAFRPAKIDEYIEWLEGYLKHGGKPTHYYDLPCRYSKFLLARRDFTLSDEGGSRARPIIVPQGIQWKSGKLGYNNLYFMADYTVAGHWVPIYNDREFEILGGYIISFIEEKIQKERRHHEKREALMEERQHSDLSDYLWEEKEGKERGRRFRRKSYSS